MVQNTIQILLDGLSYRSDFTKNEQFAHLSAEEWRAVVDLALLHNVAPP